MTEAERLVWVGCDVCEGDGLIELARARFERYAKIMGWPCERLNDGYYATNEMDDRWALWMGCLEFEKEPEGWISITSTKGEL
jgi:hypothetical protein